MNENMTLDNAHDLVLLNVIALSQKIITDTNGGGYTMPEDLYEDSYAMATHISSVLRKKIDQRLMKMATSTAE